MGEPENKRQRQLTPTRVMVFNAKPDPPGMKIRRRIADWPVEAVHLESKGMTFRAHYNQGASASNHRVIRATITWDGEERPLILDFQRSDNARAAIAAVKEATEAARS